MTSLETYMRLFVIYADFVSKMGMYHKILFMEHNELECMCKKCSFEKEENEEESVSGYEPCRIEQTYNRIKIQRMKRFRAKEREKRE